MLSAGRRGIDCSEAVRIWRIELILAGRAASELAGADHLDKLVHRRIGEPAHRHMHRPALGGLDQQHRPLLTLGDSCELEQRAELAVLGDLKVAVLEVLGGYTFGEVGKPEGIGRGAGPSATARDEECHRIARAYASSGGAKQGWA